MTTVITGDSLNQTDPLQTVTTPPDTTNYQGIIDNAVSSIPKLETTVNNGTTDTQNTLTTLSSLEKSLGLKTADTQTAEQNAGVNTEQANLDKYNQQLNDITSNLTGLANESKAIPLKIQNNNANTGATDAGVAPQTASMLRENAIKALTQSSLADVITSNIKNSSIRLDSARRKAQQAIDLKYQPIENEIAQLKEQLDLNKKYITDPAEKKLADAQSIALNERTRKIAEAKATEQGIQNIKLEVAKNGFDPSIVGDAKTIDEAITKAGTALSTPSTDVVKLDNGNTILIDKRTGKTIRNIGGSSQGSNTTIPTQVVRTVQTGTGTTPVTGYTLQSGDDPYNVAKQAGINMDELKQLNPQVTDWTKLPAGYVLNLPNADDSWLKGKTQTQVQAYNSLPDADKASVKQLVNGDALLTDIVKSRGAKTQAQITDLINKATSIDPSFSVNANKQRYTYKTQFNNPNGKDQLQIVAINTGLGHLAEFKQASDALGNSIVLPYNKLVNFLKKNTGDPKVAQLNTVITALAGELASVYKGGGAPTDQETEHWRNSILSSFSTAQSKGVSDTTANLISNKVLSMSQAYKNVMGAYPDSPIVNPDSLQQLADAGVDISAITGKLQSQGYSMPQQTETHNGFTLPGYNAPTGKSTYQGFTLPN